MGNGEIGRLHPFNAVSMAGAISGMVNCCADCDDSLVHLTLLSRDFLTKILSCSADLLMEDW